MRRVLAFLSVVCLGAVACSPQAAMPSVQQIADNPIGAATPTPRVIYITPTPAPTTIPTFELITPSVTPSPTPTLSPTPDVVAAQTRCEATLKQLYTTATELCLGKPTGYFCNGGLPPRAEPSGGVASSLANPGALVDASNVDMVNPLPLHTNESGGLVWLHLADRVAMNALLIGDVVMRDVTPTDGSFPKWQLFTIETRPPTSPCANTPRSTFIVQGLYGIPTSLVINGASITLNGTLAVLTEGQTTHFIALEGTARLNVVGELRSLYAGQQLDVSYPSGDWTKPTLPPLPAPLTWAYIEHLPIVIMDRPVLLPQPGYVQTTAMVNMRAKPDQSSTLLYQVPANTVMSVLGKSELGDWYHVRLGNGETGWMRADLLGGFVGQINATYAATPIPPQRFGALGSRAKVVAQQGGNLRQAPDVSFNAITTLPPGTEVKLLARSPYSPFVKVDANGQEGWMALITLETQSIIGFLPIDYSVPLPTRPTAVPVFDYGGGHAYPNPNGGQ
jgi:uncharacterized protein YgiM (DUF1202 family)